MELRLKVATAASVIATMVAAIALALAPVGATTSSRWMPRHGNDEFKALSVNETRASNMNNVEVNSHTEQNANSGEVRVGHIDDLKGGADTGNASNKSGTSTALAASNTPAASLPAAPAPSTPNPSNFKSFDDVKLKSMVKTEVRNTNNVMVSSQTNQQSNTGSVDVHCLDDIEGNVSTGDASNESTTSTTITLSN